MAPSTSIISIRDDAPEEPRKNFAQREPGIILVFCMAFIVGTGLVILHTKRFIERKKREKERALLRAEARAERAEEARKRRENDAAEVAANSTSNV